jgi:hypothetical protein
VSKRLLLVITLFLLAPAAPAQQRAQPPPLPAIGDPDQRPRPLGPLEKEVIKRAEIKRDEQNHSEMVERADETARLGLDLRAAFEKQQTLGREDLKRLEKIEKLARKIRGSAGGSDDEQQIEDPPTKLEEAVARLAEVTVKLNESVRKTTRHVVSGTVIQRSNEIIGLVRHVRSLLKP